MPVIEPSAGGSKIREAGAPNRPSLRAALIGATPLGATLLRASDCDRGTRPRTGGARFAVWSVGNRGGLTAPLGRDSIQLCSPRNMLPSPGDTLESGALYGFRNR